MAASCKDLPLATWVMLGNIQTALRPSPCFNFVFPGFMVIFQMWMYKQPNRFSLWATMKKFHSCKASFNST